MEQASYTGVTQRLDGELDLNKDVDFDIICRPELHIYRKGVEAPKVLRLQPRKKRNLVPLIAALRDGESVVEADESGNIYIIPNAQNLDLVQLTVYEV